MPRCISQNCLQSFPASGCFPASFPIPVAGHCPPTSLQETFRHSQLGLTQSPVGLLPLPPGSWCIQGFVCALQEWSRVFPPVLWKSYNQILLVFKSDSLEMPGSFAGSPDWEDFGPLTGEDEHVSFYSAVWNQSLFLLHVFKMRLSSHNSLGFYNSLFIYF